MSAIAGLVALRRGVPLRSTAERMSNGLAGFGPHGSGRWEAPDRDATLVWRQFQSLPEDLFDRQPLRSPDGVHAIAADARIDNLAELKAELGLGASPDLPDAAVILAAWRAWGEACVDRLVGDFAFAVWDDRAKSLFLARDPIGWRPLYWASTDQAFGFASMPRGLFAMEGVSSEADELNLAGQLLLQPPHGEGTVYRDIHRVPPGWCMTVTAGQRRSRAWWTAPHADRVRFRRYGDSVEALRETYTEAVRCRLRSNGGVAAQVSAGWDSTSVTVIAARLLAGQGRRLSAFTAAPREGFAGPTYMDRVADEFPFAAAVMAGEPNIDHFRVSSHVRSHLEVIRQQTQWQDLPTTGSINMAWSNRIAAAAHQRGARVVLCGAFGNITVSYEGDMALPMLLRQGRWLTLARVMAGLRREGRGLAWSGWRALGPLLSARHQETLSRLRTLGRIDGGYQRAALNASHGVDLRDPTSDRRVIELTLAIPEEHFVHEGRPAALFRDAMAGILPEPHLARRVRGLQSADWYEGVVADRDELAAHVERLARSPRACSISPGCAPRSPNCRDRIRRWIYWPRGTGAPRTPCGATARRCCAR